MVILEYILSKVLLNIVDYNIKIQSQRKFLFPTYIVRFQNIFVAKNVHYYVLKSANIFKKMIKMIFSLYKICGIY
jgi:hypothetical protein